MLLKRTYTSTHRKKNSQAVRNRKNPQTKAKQNTSSRSATTAKKKSQWPSQLKNTQLV